MNTRQRFAAKPETLVDTRWIGTSFEEASEHLHVVAANTKHVHVVGLFRTSTHLYHRKIPLRDFLSSDSRYTYLGPSLKFEWIVDGTPLIRVKDYDQAPVAPAHRVWTVVRMYPTHLEISLSDEIVREIMWPETLHWRLATSEEVVREHDYSYRRARQAEARERRRLAQIVNTFSTTTQRPDPQPPEPPPRGLLEVSSRSSVWQRLSGVEGQLQLPFEVGVEKA